MRDVTAWFVIVAPPLVLVADAVVFFLDGYEATITAVIRDWSEDSCIPEVVFIVGAVLLWGHLFRRWF